MSHNGGVRWVFLAAAVTCATCGAPESSRKPAPGPKVSPAAFPSGLFAITAARVVTDNCDNRLRFETTILDIDLGSATVMSGPDNHTYEAVLDRGELVARGAFDKNGTCQTYRQLEIWRLERDGNDELSGFRTTYWRDRRLSGNTDCLRACKVVYAIEAVRTDEAESKPARPERPRVRCDPNDPLCGI